MVRICRAFLTALDLECASSAKVKEKVYGGEHYEQKRNNHIHKS